MICHFKSLPRPLFAIIPSCSCHSSILSIIYQRPCLHCSQNMILQTRFAHFVPKHESLQGSTPTACSHDSQQERFSANSRRAGLLIVSQLTCHALLTWWRERQSQLQRRISRPILTAKRGRSSHANAHGEVIALVESTNRLETPAKRLVMFHLFRF